MVFHTQNSFHAGMVDPEFLARSDTGQYANAAKQLINVLPLNMGGVRRRPAGAYRATLAALPQLEGFVFSDDQAYVFAFLNTSLAIYDPDDGTLLTTVNSCPWTTAMLGELNTAQDGDVMIVTHGTMAPQKITRTGAATFTVAEMAFEASAAGDAAHQPYFKFADPGVTLNPSGTTGSITLVMSADVFVAGHVGTYFRYKGNEIEITAVTNATTATGTVRKTLASSTADADWDEAAFSDVRGWPSAVSFHQNRMFLAGSDELPSHLAGSKIGAFFNHDLGSGNDDEAIFIQMSTRKVSRIRHLVSEDHLLIFTSDGFGFIPHSITSPLTPGNARALQSRHYGTIAGIRPQLFDKGVLFLQKTRNVLRDVTPASSGSTVQRWEAIDVSLLTHNLFDAPVDMAAIHATDERPEQFAVLVNADGSIICYHGLRDEDMRGFAKWTTEGQFRRVAEVDDRLFAVAERTVNGVTRYFLEEMLFARQLDGGIIVTVGAATTSFSGFTHLASQTVHLVSGDFYLGTATVDGSGNVTAPAAVTTLEAGFAHYATVETLPPEFTIPRIGQMGSELKSISRIVLQLHATMSVSIDGTELILRQTTDDLSIAPEARTGREEFYIDGGWEIAPTITITQAEPLDFTLLGMYMEVEI